MKNSMKNKVVSVLTLIMCLMFAILIGMNANFANAQTQTATDTNVFTLYNTASIRDASGGRSAGIRFVAKLGQEKFTELNNGNEINVVFVANKVVDGLPMGTPVEKSYTVFADSFTGDSDGIIDIRHTLSFEGLDNEKLEQAKVMDLKVDCYAEVAGEEVSNTRSSITQNARSVASFNDLLDGTSNYAVDYYSEATAVEGVASYVGGEKGVKITIDGADENSDVYINTYKVNNATISDNVVTIEDADKVELLTTTDKNFIQLINETGNVVAREINNEIPVVDGGYYSQVDGYPISVNDNPEVEIIANDADTDGTFDTLTIESGVVKGLEEIKTDALTNVTMLVKTDYTTEERTVKAAKKIIDKASDLKSVYGASGDTITGYFYVSKNIEYNEENPVEIKPPYTNFTTGSKFSGIFDGGGHTIEYGIYKGGLFGILASATVKNASFVVKAVKDEDSANTIAADLGMYAILAGFMEASRVENVHATYAVDITPNLTKLGNNYRFRGLGLFGVTHYGQLENVVLDLSNVEGVTPGANMGYGVLMAPLSSSYGFNPNPCKNVHVIWTVKELCWYESNKPSAALLRYAESDAEYEVPTGLNIDESRVTPFASTYRYNTLAAMADAVSKVGNFEITASGVTWVNN